jgi:hypothetical protein
MKSLSFLACLVVGCGSDVTADQACTALAQDTCTKLSTCAAADLQRRWPDLATCETRQKLACTDALKAPKTAQNPTREDTCGSEIAAESCTTYLSGVEPPNECTAPVGPLATGAACSFAGQCATGFCAIASNALCGTCATEPVAGASCANSGCGQTLNCVATTMLCQAPVTDGGACSRDLPCIQGEACVGATQTAMGTCMAQVTTAGATCDARTMTGPNCDPAAGLVCNTMTNMCVMQPLVAAGQTCGVINNVNTGCLAGATCQRATGSMTGTCVGPAADGATCDATNGPDCTTPAKCVAGTCQLPGSMSCS